MSDTVTEHDEITDLRMTESLTDNILSDKSPQYSVVSERDAAPSSSSSSSSDSESVPQLTETSPPLPPAVQENAYHLFGRDKPVHEVFGGGRPADIFLWRNKKFSGSVLAVATAVWVLFELLECHLLTLVCHIAILVLSLSFLWSNISVIINKKSPHIPEIRLPEHNFLEVASALQVEINRALDVLREIASGKDLKKFLTTIFSLWFLSLVGSFCSFLTLCYIPFVLLLTVPVLYEKYDDKIDAFAEKASAEIKKLYAVFDEKVPSKIPLGRKKRD